MADVKTQRSCQPVLIGAGAAAGLLAGWSCIALALWSVGAIRHYFSPSFLVLALAALLLVLPSLPISGFAMGMSCAFFWHSIITEEQLEKWRIGVLIVLFLPTFWLGLLNAIAAICLLAPIIVRKFNIGIETGMHWWPQKRWRHLFGLSNGYERDENER